MFVKLFLRRYNNFCFKGNGCHQIVYVSRVQSYASVRKLHAHTVVVKRAVLVIERGVKRISVIEAHYGSAVEIGIRPAV